MPTFGPNARRGQWLIDLANGEPRAWIMAIIVVGLVAGGFYAKRWYLNRL